MRKRRGKKWRIYQKVPGKRRQRSFPPTMKVEMCEYNLKVPPQRKKAAAVGQACCGKVGNGIICLRRVEKNSVDSDADLKRRRKHDKGNIAKRKQVISANMVTSDPRHHCQLIWTRSRRCGRPFTTSRTRIGKSWDWTRWFNHFS